jgi:hypothetical protein
MKGKQKSEFAHLSNSLFADLKLAYMPILTIRLLQYSRATSSLIDKVLKTFSRSS